VDAYSQAIRRRFDDAGAWTGRGRAYNQLGRYSASIDDFDQAVPLNPKPALSYIERLPQRPRLFRSPATTIKVLSDLEQAVTLTPNAAEA